MFENKKTIFSVKLFILHFLKNNGFLGQKVQ